MAAPITGKIKYKMERVHWKELPKGSGQARMGAMETIKTIRVIGTVGFFRASVSFPQTLGLGRLEG